MLSRPRRALPGTPSIAGKVLSVQEPEPRLGARVPGVLGVNAALVAAEMGESDWKVEVGGR
jgi:hypothetical protein